MKKYILLLAILIVIPVLGKKPKIKLKLRAVAQRIVAKKSHKRHGAPKVAQQPVRQPVVRKVVQKAVLKKQSKKVVHRMQQKPVVRHVKRVRRHVMQPVVRHQRTQQQPVRSAPVASEQQGQVDALGMKALQLTNNFRASQGLPALKWDQRLANIAHPHAVNMGNSNSISHNGFREVRAPQMRAASCAENVAMNHGYTDPVTQAVDGWIHSPGHRRNMLGQFTHCAISIYRNARGAYYFTQLFARY